MVPRRLLQPMAGEITGDLTKGMGICQAPPIHLAAGLSSGVNHCWLFTFRIVVAFQPAAAAQPSSCNHSSLLPLQQQASG